MRNARSSFRDVWSRIMRRLLGRSEVIIHDPAAAEPHDLDDPLFDRKVQERVGAEIAKAALRKK
jgi:hypothetical protein